MSKLNAHQSSMPLNPESLDSSKPRASLHPESWHWVWVRLLESSCVCVCVCVYVCVCVSACLYDCVFLYLCVCIFHGGRGGILVLEKRFSYCKCLAMSHAHNPGPRP